MKLLTLIVSVLLCFEIMAFDYSPRADKISGKFTKELKKKLGISCIGTGGGGMHHLRSISLSYRAPFFAKIVTARILYVTCVEELIFRLGQDAPLRPYMANYPLEIDNIDLRLGFCSTRNLEIKEVGLVIQAHGIVHFAIDHPITDRYETIWEEPYSESKNIVKEQFGRIPRLADLYLNQQGVLSVRDLPPNPTKSRSVP